MIDASHVKVHPDEGGVRDGKPQVVAKKFVAEIKRKNLHHGKKQRCTRLVCRGSRPKGGFNTKIHLAVDAHGVSVRFFSQTLPLRIAKLLRR